MASVGFAVGLGNIWRFPYVTGENGGSAFVLVYLACVAAIGVPFLMAEILLGRKGGRTPAESMARLAEQAGSTRRWAWVGHLNLLTAFTILIAYGVVAGWVLHYLFLAFTGEVVTLSSGAASLAAFDALLADVPQLVFWTLLAFCLAGAIVFAGVEHGIERAVVVLMPALFVLLVVLAVFNVFAGGMQAALAYLFTPDFSKLTPDVLLAAVGQAFFSIGVGMAGMMMYGAYLKEDVSIASSALIIVLADTLVALVAGLVIFPMVFAHGLDPAGGSGLIFQTLPLAFSQMASGTLIAALFFLLLAVAAITSIVGLLEPQLAWVVARTGWSRYRATVTVIAVLLTASLLSTLSYNHWADVTVFGSSLSAVIDFLPNQVFLPLGGLLIAVFAGYVLPRAVSAAGLGLPVRAFSAWHGLLRYVAAPAVLVILVSGLFG